MLLYTFSLSFSLTLRFSPTQKAHPLGWGWKGRFYTIFCTFSCCVTHPGFDFPNILLTQGKKTSGKSKLLGPRAVDPAVT